VRDLPVKQKLKVNTFDREMSLEEVEREKQKGTVIGEALKKADNEYKKRRKK